MAGETRVNILVLILCLGINLDKVEASHYDACRRVLLHSDFRSPCGSLKVPHIKPCIVSTAADQQYLKDVKIRYLYRPPGVKGPMICAPRWNNTQSAECVSAPSVADDSVGWTWSQWTPSGEDTSSRRIALTGDSSSILCMYVENRKDREITLTIDNIGEMYVDGQQVGGTMRWPRVYTLNLRLGKQLVAFEARNTGGAMGVRALLSNGVKTDDQSGWLCTEEYEEDWNQVDFDDSHWNPVKIEFSGHSHIVGGGARTIGCLRWGRGPDYFRIRLT